MFVSVYAQAVFVLSSGVRSLEHLLQAVSVLLAPRFSTWPEPLTVVAVSCRLLRSGKVHDPLEPLHSHHALQSKYTHCFVGFDAAHHFARTCKARGSVNPPTPWCHQACEIPSPPVVLPWGSKRHGSAGMN